MPVSVIADKLKMAQKTIRKIVAGIPSPHEDTQALFAHLGQIRKHREIIPLTSFADIDERL